MADIYQPRTWVDGELLNASNSANRWETGLESLDVIADDHEDRLAALEAGSVPTVGAKALYGPSANRPQPAHGTIYFDTDLGKYIGGYGTEWRNLDGTALTTGGGGPEPDTGTAPTGMTAVVNPDNSIQLTWNPVTGADHYKLYEIRSPSGVSGADNLLTTSSVRTPSSMAGCSVAEFDSEALSANGVDLASLCYMTTDISELLTVPTRRGENAVVPGRHGVIRTRNKKFDVGELVLPLWIVGCNPDESIPWDSTERIEFFKRRDEILRVFMADEVALQFTRPDGTVTEAICEVMDVIDFTRRQNEPLARVSIALRVIGSFWRDVAPVSQTITGATGTIVTLDAFAAATAPMSDLVVTFTGPVNNPRLQHGASWLQYNGVIATGRELVLDSGFWSASAGFGLEWQPDLRQVFRYPGPAWLELDPTQTSFQIRFDHTGGGVATVEIAGRRAYLSP